MQNKINVTNETILAKPYCIIEGEESIQGSDKWLQFRKGKISASIAGTIMGVNPWQTKLELYEEVVFDKKKPKTKAMQRGNDMEEEARDWINKRLGVNYKPVVVQSIFNPNFIASLDGFYIDRHGNECLLEIKCAGIQAHGDALAGRVPEYYMPQLQHQMYLVDADHILYLSYYDGEGVMVNVKRDDKYCEILVREEHKFLEMIQNKTPPDASDKDWIVISDEEMLVKAHRYSELSRLIDELESEKSEIKLFMIKNSPHPRMKIGDLKLQMTVRKGNVDVKKLAEAYGIDDLDKYRGNDIESWRITE